MKRKLTDSDVINAGPNDKPYNLTDGGGLYLKITEAGKYWRYNYSHNGKQKTYAMGVYPDTSLNQARDKHQAARELLAQGVDPSSHKQVVQGERLEKISQHPSFSPKSKEYEDTIMTFAVIGAMATTGGDAEEAARLLGVTVEFINERF